MSSYSPQISSLSWLAPCELSVEAEEEEEDKSG